MGGINNIHIRIETEIILSIHVNNVYIQVQIALRQCLVLLFKTDCDCDKEWFSNT